MDISRIMSRDVRTLSPGNTIAEAAREMAAHQIGAVPVAENHRLIGMVTDRDIVVRGIAAGKADTSPLSEVITEQVFYCMEDEPVEDVASNMAELQVQRIPVVNRDKRLVGIVSLGDIVRAADLRIGGALAANVKEERAV